MDEPNNTLPISLASLPTNVVVEKVRRDYSDRMLPSEALGAVSDMLACYPHPPANERYIGSLAFLLASYPRSVALRCTDPIKGVARHCKYPPTIGDVSEWCEHDVGYMRRIIERDDRFQAIERENQRD